MRRELWLLVLAVAAWFGYRWWADGRSTAELEEAASGSQIAEFARAARKRVSRAPAQASAEADTEMKRRQRAYMEKDDRTKDQVVEGASGR
jgi:predicted negative regulator of RcsB-dependent stress response